MIKKIKELLAYDRIHYQNKISTLVIIILSIISFLCFIIASQL